MRRLVWALLFALALTSAPALPPAQTSPPPTTHSQGNPNVKVWVNTKTGVYHCPGSRWYGTTKQGEFMTQKEAQDKGYRPAYGKVCQ
jgi:hypothetical protein